MELDGKALLSAGYKKEKSCIVGSQVYSKEGSNFDNINMYGLMLIRFHRHKSKIEIRHDDINGKVHLSLSSHLLDTTDKFNTLLEKVGLNEFKI